MSTQPRQLHAHICHRLEVRSDPTAIKASRLENNLTYFDNNFDVFQMFSCHFISYTLNVNKIRNEMSLGNQFGVLFLVFMWFLGISIKVFVNFSSFNSFKIERFIKYHPILSRLKDIRQKGTWERDLGQSKLVT